MLCIKGDESDDKPISTEMLEDIRGGSQFCPNVNRREAGYKVRDGILKTKIGVESSVKSYAKHGQNVTLGF